MAEKVIAIKVDLKGTEAQQKKLAKLETEVKKLTTRRTELNKALKAGTISLKEYGNGIAKVNTGLKAHRRELLVTREQILGMDGFTKKLGKSFARLGTSIAGAFAGMFAIQKVGQLFSDAVNIFKQFEQANANLASVLGTTSDKISSLTNDATRLGAATAFSATEVSKLQTEFAKLGFTESQILDATEATLSLAAATGSDLAEAAAIAGATLGGFGLEAKETQKVVDIMAKSFSSSALDIEKFKESMKIAAPAAKAVGVSVEETTALLGTLANAGISGSLAGTGLAKSFIQLNKAGLTLQDGLDKVANANNKLDEAVKLVGVNAAKSFLILAEGTETTKALKTGLENAGGAAKRMADTQLDTLEGKTKILNSAWEGLVLSLTAGDSAFNRIAKGIVEATTSILNFLTTSENAAEVSRENVKANRDLANSSKALLIEYETLTEKGVKATKEEKQRLDVITLRLKRTLGDSVVAIDKETGAFKLNTEEVKRQIKLKRLQVDQEASTAAGRFLNSKDRIENIQAEIKAQELALETAETVRRREIDLENQRIKGRSIRFKNSKEFIQATKDQVAAQKALRELNESLIVAEGKRVENLKVLTEAGYNAAEAEDLLGESTKESTEVIEDNNKASTKRVEILEDYNQQLEELDDNDPLDNPEFNEDAFEKVAKDRLDFLTQDNKKLTDLALKQKDKETEQFAKKNQEKAQQDFEFAELVESKKIELAQQTANALVDIANNKIQREKDLELSALDAKLQNELITQEEFEKQREAIERKAFKKQKKLQLAQVAISLATELASIAANSAGNPLNAFTGGGAGVAQNQILGAIAVARSAIQAGVIASQKFADGGYTGSGFGSPDSSGFKQAGVVHEGEYVVPKNVLESQRGGQLVGALESMRMNKPTPLSNIGFANGGFTSGNNLDLSDMESRISNAVISSIGAIKVQNVATDTTTEAVKVNNIMSEATFG
tara:strand:+ start:875 stop:3754 length:2880 start_codon:yes stop_codon:yes gene_type:complete